MKGNIEERAVLLAQYIIEHKATVRSAAQQFGVSKSTVHTVHTKRNGIYGVLNKAKGAHLAMCAFCFWFN